MRVFLSLTFISQKLKEVSKFFILFIALNTVTCIAPQRASAQVSISFQVFYDNLTPYGNWVDNSDYGYVWVPRVARGFYPYGTNGHWVFTREGWTWVSSYSWGWAPFHYGRWFYDSWYGWVWVPDNEWGPGWVSWRRSEGYYGWAPIGSGISVDIAYSNSYTLPCDRWRLVRDRDFGRTNINNYYVSTTNYTTIINKSVVINNIQVDNSRHVRYNAGPDRTEVERRAGKIFSPIVIKESKKPGQNLNKGQLQIYRPQVQRNISAERKPAPAKVEGWKKNQPTSQPPVQQKRNDPPKSQQSVQQKRHDQPVKQQPIQQKRNDQPIRQQPAEQKRNDQPIKQQPVQQKRNDQPTKQPPVQQKHNEPTKQQPEKRKPSQTNKENPTKKETINEISADYSTYNGAGFYLRRFKFSDEDISIDWKIICLASADQE
jgi:hypothetical protein